MSEGADRNWTSSRVRAGGVAFVVALILICGAYWFLFATDFDELVKQGRKQFALGNSRAALELAKELLADRPEDVDALLLAADASFAVEEFDLALGYYRQVPDDSTQEAVYARFRCGRIELHHVGDTAAAEASFRSALEREPDDRNGLFQLVSLLGIQGRASEATPFVLRLYRQGVFYPEFLDLLWSEDVALLNADELQRWRRVAPDDAGVLTGLAWHARNSGDLKDAITLLTRALESSPKCVQARVTLASILWEQKQYAFLRNLLADEQTKQVDSATLWIMRGNLAAHDGQPHAAARCYWQAWKRDSTSRIATYRLYRYLSSEGDDENASAMRLQLSRLQMLQEHRDVVRSSRLVSSEPIQQLIGALEDVGRLWEAWGWCVLARDRYPNATWVEPQLAELSRQLETAPLTVVCSRISHVDLSMSHLPLPRWTSVSPEAPGVVASMTSNVSFRDDAEAAGISFQYFNSPSPAGEGQRMYEFNGGGAGVLDFDQDGWPDLHFTQGCQWPVRDENNGYLDRLYRNLATDGFEDVTDRVCLAENRFSTGVAIGDFDNDGFPDVHVANIGRNRLFRNNGDGTFEDVTDEAGIGDPRWSTSCVMADLNGDALPDIYSVNYLSGDTVFEDVCQHDDGHPRMCMPFHFPGEQDQLFLNRGDGRFVNATDEAGIQNSNGKGLGVVAADWSQDGRLSLFVANDTVANSLFVNAGSNSSGMPRFVESGLLSGAAVNRDGRAEGCMGIAAGDANGDGTLDVFVTNFLNETNTLYLTDTAVVFSDATREAGLAEPGRDLLGFGTQFLDADLDGHLDLLIANGHIDDYRRYGRPYTMPAQFFSNDGTGRFWEREPEIVGPYFDRRVLGRGMSRLDWNRDGFEDVVICHLDQPATLLTNTSREPNAFVALRICGTTSARDAHGTTVVVQTENLTITRQLTAGDGYQASNERVLIFGLGHSATIQRIDVRWPSGITESFLSVDKNREYLIVEGTGRLARLSGASD